MKIAYVVQTFPKRSETFVRDEVEWMARQGYLDRIFTLESDPDLLDELSDDVRQRIQLLPQKNGLHKTSIKNFLQKIRLTPSLARSRLKARSISRESGRKFAIGAELAQLLCKETLPDLIHVHFASIAAQIARYASHITSIPYTFCTHHYDIFLNPPANYAVLTYDAARMTTISDYNRRYLIEHFSLPEPKIQVVHCGIDTEQFDHNRQTPTPNTAADPSILNLISVGRLVEVKAHRYQIEAARLLADEGLDFKLRIIGDGDQRDALAKQIESLDLSDRVTLLGAQSSTVVRQELKRADIFVMSSLSEGIPVSLMEAMATRLPVVTTGVRGIPELVVDQVNGLLVPEHSPESLADAIRQLAADPARRACMGDAGRSRVLASYNANTEYSKLIDIWREISF